MANPFTFFKKVCNRLLTIIELTRKVDPYLRHRHTRAPRLPRKLCKPAGWADGDLSPEKGEGGPGASKTHAESCVRGEGGAGGGGEVRGEAGGDGAARGNVRPAVFSVQPRNDKTQVFSFKTKKKKVHLPAHPPNHIDHAQSFPNTKFRRTNNTHKYAHT